MREPQRQPGVADPMRKLSPHTIALIGLGLLLAIILLFVVTRGGDSSQDKLGDAQVGGNTAADDPESRCSAQATYDRLKRELFRRAAAVRASDQVAYDKLVAYAVLRAETPILRSYDQRVNSVTCSAFLSLDLPPGVAVVGGRRTLSADVTYSLQPATDGTGEVLTLTEADAIVTPLATLARVGTDTGTASTGDNSISIIEPAQDGTTSNPPQPSVPAEPVRPAPTPPRASTNPSFDCDDARTRGEVAVCQNPDLAALDRTMAAQYRRAVDAATPGERTILAQTRNRFLRYRDRCQTLGCMRDAYTGRMREIRDITEGRWRGR